MTLILHAGGVRAARGFDVRRGVIALRDLLQRHVVARLGADVEEREAGLAQGTQVVVALLEDVPCHGVAGHAAEAWEASARALEDRQPVIHREDERVAVRDEELLDLVADRRARAIEILERLRELAHAERLVAVHVAIRAVVPRAADRGLQDQRVGFRRRAVEATFVTHRRSCSSSRSAIDPLQAPVPGEARALRLRERLGALEDAEEVLSEDS